MVPMLSINNVAMNSIFLEIMLRLTMLLSSFGDINLIAQKNLVSPLISNTYY